MTARVKGHMRSVPGRKRKVWVKGYERKERKK
jgi:hypothetical protein